MRTTPFALALACLLVASCTVDVNGLSTTIGASGVTANAKGPTDHATPGPSAQPKASATPAPSTPAPAADPALKENDTPSFYQEDQDAGFENGGENYCAPTSVSDGLIYLALGRHLNDLVPGTDHTGQIDLIKQLADHMNTDPNEGTPPSGIIAGLQSYADAHGYSVNRLEVATWRSIGSDNQQFRVGKVPDLSWMRAAAQGADTVLLFNVGWYKDGDNGYKRDNGHWVDVVGVGSGPTDFELRNPAIEAADQTRKTSVTLTGINGDFTRIGSDGNPYDMTGYYKVQGPGLPYGGSVKAAVLDGAVVFSMSK